MKQKTALLTRFFAQSRSLHVGAMLLRAEAASPIEAKEEGGRNQRLAHEPERRTLCPGGFNCPHCQDFRIGRY